MQLVETDNATYEKGSLIGAGAFSRIYAVTNTATGSVYAIAFPTSTDPTSEALLNGYQLLLGMHHDNVVSVLDRGTAKDGRPFVLMPFLDKMITLEQYRRTRMNGIEPETIARIASQLGEAVSSLHKASIVHGDLHPGNVLINPSDHAVKLIDFGLSHRDDEGDKKANHRVLMYYNTLGRVGFLAPEVVQTGLLGNRSSDIYAFGATLYYLMVGQPPLGSFQKPSRLRSDISATWDLIVDNCINPNPEERLSDIEIVLPILQALKHDTPPQERVIELETPNDTLAYALGSAVLLFNLAWLLGGAPELAGGVLILTVLAFWLIGNYLSRVAKPH